MSKYFLAETNFFKFKEVYIVKKIDNTKYQIIKVITPTHNLEYIKFLEGLYRSKKILTIIKEIPEDKINSFSKFWKMFS